MLVPPAFQYVISLYNVDILGRTYELVGDLGKITIEKLEPKSEETIVHNDLLFLFCKGGVAANFHIDNSLGTNYLPSTHIPDNSANDGIDKWEKFTRSTLLVSKP